MGKGAFSRTGPRARLSRLMKSATQHKSPTMRSMGLHNMGKRIWRITWQSLPAATRDFLRFVAYPNVVGRINRQRPQVEVFGASRSDKAGNQLRAQLEKVNVNAPTNLCRIMKKFGSDKGMGRHNYTTVYRQLFADMQKKPVRLFELGIGTNNPALASSMGVAGKPGASLWGWSEFFASGKIFAADIDRAILFNEGRINTLYCDQLDTNSIREMWAKPALKDPFDVVIEDGLHTFEANLSFLKGSLHKVRKGGYYVIEDIKLSERPAWREVLQHKYTAAHPDFSFCLVTLPWRFNDFDNCLLVARRG